MKKQEKKAAFLYITREAVLLKSANVIARSLRRSNLIISAILRLPRSRWSLAMTNNFNKKDSLKNTFAIIKNLSALLRKTLIKITEKHCYY